MAFTHRRLYIKKATVKRLFSEFKLKKQLLLRAINFMPDGTPPRFNPKRKVLLTTRNQHSNYPLDTVMFSAHFQFHRHCCQQNTPISESLITLALGPIPFLDRGRDPQKVGRTRQVSGLHRTS